MTRPTDHRNLDLWQFNLDVLFGRAGGKVLWQPRILAWFTDREFAREPLPGRYRGMTEVEVYRSLGCSNRVYDYNACFQQVDPPGLKRRQVDLDPTHIRYVIETPAGTVTQQRRTVTTSWFPPIEKQWIETPDDMRVFTWIAEHTGWEWNQSQFDQAEQKWGRLGAPTMWIPHINVQRLFLDDMGVEAAIYAIYEWGPIVKDYFRALNENHLRLIDVINASPIQIVNFGDNVHGETCSPALYEEYVLPAYRERCARLHRAGKFVHAHWDGKVKPLLKYARCSGLDGIEAITPLPQGDVTLEETKDALGDDIYLLDGIPAVFFDATFAEDELLACAEKTIKLFAPKLVLGISDEISSHGDLDRIRLVGKIVDDYNASVAQASRR